MDVDSMTVTARLAWLAGLLEATGHIDGRYLCITTPSQSTAESVVELLGGKVSIRVRAGRRTQFRVRVPLSKGGSAVYLILPLLSDIRAAELAPVALASPHLSTTKKGQK